MNNKPFNGTLLWKQLEDVLVPALGLNHIDRAVYSHLLRHTLLEGQPRIRFSVSWLAAGARVTYSTVRLSLHRLVDKGVLRLIECTRAGHLIEMRHPDQIRPARPARALSAPSVAPTSRFPSPAPLPLPPDPDLEQLDFMSSKRLRETIHLRDRRLCFYCLCRLRPRTRCLDHVIPRVRSGRNSYRNLVSACFNCNSGKGPKPAPDFLRSLYRQGRITAPELTARLHALHDLAAGKLRPTLPIVKRRAVRRPT